MLIFFGSVTENCYFCIYDKQSSMEQNESKRSIIADYYERHYEELRSFVASRLPSRGEEEDIVQDVFLRLLQMDRMITPVTLPCLVYTTARNLVSDRWRHSKRVEEYEHLIARGDWQSALAEDVESVYSAQEIMEIMERGIATLSDRQQKVYRLNVYDGLQVKDISVQLNVSYKNVENRLGTARKTVRNYVRRMLAS